MRFLIPMSVAALLAAGSLDAQVSGAVVIGGGPVSGAVVFGEPVLRRQVYRPRVVVIEDWRGPRGRGRGWWRNQGFREVVIYRNGGRFYDRWDNRRPAERVVVYERGGHYYDRRWFDDRYYDRRDSRRWDNRRYDDDRRWDRDRDRRGRDDWRDDRGRKDRDRDRWDD